MNTLFRKLPKIHLVLGKKHLVIAGLTLVLGAAVTVNVLFAGNNADLKNKSDTENYGEATLVSSDSKNVSKSGDYFTQARLDKQASRDEAKDFIKAVANGGDILAEEAAVISDDASALSGYIESETKIETVLKAQGFTDVLCYLSESGANIIVKTQGLTAEDAAKIKNALLSEVNVPVDKITIVEIN